MSKPEAFLACDDRGHVSPSTGGKAFTIGGFAALMEHQPALIKKWRSIKAELCVSPDVELKWSHFFPGPHQRDGDNPLKSNSPDDWRKEAFWALTEFFDGTAAFPITAIVMKDRMGEAYLTTTPKGAEVIDVGLILTVVMGQFAVYLREYDIPSGEIWLDRMGSEVEEDRIRKGYQKLIDSLPDSALPEKNKRIAQRVSSTIRFLDSANEPMIQIADFVSGVISAAAEGDDAFLLDLLDYYAPGRKKTYGIVVLEE